MRLGRSLPPAQPHRGHVNLFVEFAAFWTAKGSWIGSIGAEGVFRVKHCFLVSSGKAAFALILLALKELFPDRDEVLIRIYLLFSSRIPLLGLAQDTAYVTYNQRV